MAIREELTGNFFMGDSPEVTTEILEQIAEQRTIQQDFEHKARILEEEKRQESWKGKSIMPFGSNIMVHPYRENPYLKKLNEVGLLLDSKTFDNPDSGEKDELNLGIPCGKVMEVGPDVKYVKRGDEILYMTRIHVPVPFMNSGFLLLNENNITCIINDDVNLKSRFKHLSDD